MYGCYLFLWWKKCLPISDQFTAFLLSKSIHFIDLADPKLLNGSVYMGKKLRYLCMVMTECT